MSDTVDVCVTDGFTGNVVLKTLEGGLQAVDRGAPRPRSTSRSTASPPTALMPALMPLYETLNPDTYGGAILLGVDGVCIIAHGSSSATAIRNGIGVARDMVECDIVTEITNAIAAATA